MTRRQNWVLTMALAAALLPAGPARADTEEVKGKLDRERVDLNLKDAAFLDVFKVYKQLLGVEVQIRCTADRRVSISFANLTVRTSLNAICESAGLRWTLVDGQPPVLRIDCDAAAPAQDSHAAPLGSPGEKGAGQAPPRSGKKGKAALTELVSIELKDADFGHTLAMTVELLGVERLVMDRKLDGRKISLKVEKTTIRDLLDTICAQAGARWEIRQDPTPTMMVGARP